MEKGKEKTCTLLHYGGFVLLITGFCVNVVSLFYPTRLTDDAAPPTDDAAPPTDDGAPPTDDGAPPNNGAAPPTDETETIQQQQLLWLQDPRVLILRTGNMFLLVGLHCLQILYRNQQRYWPKPNTLFNLWTFVLLVVGLCCQVAVFLGATGCAIESTPQSLVEETESCLAWLQQLKLFGCLCSLVGYLIAGTIMITRECTSMLPEGGDTKEKI